MIMLELEMDFVIGIHKLLVFGLARFSTRVSSLATENVKQSQWWHNTRTETDWAHTFQARPTRRLSLFLSFSCLSSI